METHRGCLSDDEGIQKMSEASIAINRQLQLENEPSTRADAASASRTPLVLGFDTGNAEDPNKFCAGVGNPPAVISFETEGSTRPCNSEAVVFTAEKRSILVGTLLPTSRKIIANAFSVSTSPERFRVSVCFDGDVTIPASHTSVGYTDRYMLYVGAAPTSPGTVAFAGPCAIETQTYRLVAGFMNFGTQYIARSKQMQSVVVHEIFHALGFIGYYLANYAQIMRRITFQRETNVTKLVLASPKVVEKLRNYIGCTSGQPAPTFLELEDGGSHMESRVLRQDVMVASVPYDYAFLNEVTLAVFHDMPRHI